MIRLLQPGFARHRARRRSVVGASSLEVVVAFTLLAAVISTSIPLVVRHNRLLAEQRDYQRALNELTNQMELVTTWSPDEASAALADIKPSQLASELLPVAELRGAATPAEMGHRVELSLTWQGRYGRPVSLVGWIFPHSSATDEGSQR